MKTFDIAKNKLQDNNYHIIYLMDEYEVTESSWESEEELTIVRFSKAEDQELKSMLKVKSGTFTLSHITLDGNSNLEKENDNGKLINCKSIITVDSGAELIINKGTRLTNNDVSLNLNESNTVDPLIIRYGGAIYSEGNISIDNGTIDYCKALGGGGICIKNATLNIQEATIDSNIANEKGMVADNYSFGGGILVLGAGEAKIANITITNNKAQYGGGISLGNNKIWSNSNRENLVLGNKIGELDSNILIDDNIGNSVGGGIYVGTSYRAHIYDGIISNNKAYYGYFGGGGIYVNNGFKEDEAGNSAGLLTVENVLITDNKAEIAGSGIAGCHTSNTTIIDDNGSIIHDNYLNNQSKSDIAILTTNGELADAYGSSKVGGFDHINRFMFDETPYQWKLVSDKTFASESYLNSEGGKHLYTDKVSSLDEKHDKQIRVKIIGNTSGKRGGGIGSNGRVIIGGNYSENSFNVSKEWIMNLEDNKEEPRNISALRIWLLGSKNQGFKFISYEEIYNLDTGWKNNKKVSFDKIVNQGYEPVILEEIILNNNSHYWSSGNNNKDSLIPIITEIMNSEYNLGPENINWVSDSDSPYLSEINSTDDGNYILTNKAQYGNLNLEKLGESNNETISIPENGFKFTITLINPDETPLEGNYSYIKTNKIVTDSGVITNGSIFYLKENEVITIKDLPVGTKFIIDEESGVYTTLYTNQEGIIVDNLEGTITTSISDRILRAINYFGAPISSLNIPIQKIINNGSATLVDTFEFELIPSEDYGNKIILPKDNTIIIKGNGTNNFNITFKEVGNYSFSIKEKDLNNKNYIKDNSIYTLNVTVNKITPNEFSIIPELTKTNGEINQVIDYKIGQVIQFVNTYNPPTEEVVIPDVGNLRVSKIVTGSGADTSKEFHFTVTLSDPTINGPYGQMNFINGVANVTLRHGQSILAENLPSSLTYRVEETESNQDGYRTTENNTAGAITKGKEVTATFVNTYNNESPKLTLKKEQSQNGGPRVTNTLEVNSGELITYYLTVTNNGSAKAEKVVIKDEIPIDLLLIDGSISDNGTVEGNTITWNIGDLAEKESKTVSFMVEVPEVDKTTSWKNIATTYYSDETEETPSNDVTITTDIANEEEEEDNNPSQIPEVTIYKKQLLTGQDFVDSYIKYYEDDYNIMTYEISIENISDVEATNVVIMDPIPSGTILVEGSITDDGIVDNNMITWNIGSLAPNEIREVYFTVIIPNEVQQVRNKASLTYTEDMPIESNEVIAGTSDTADDVGSPQFPEDNNPSDSGEPNYSDSTNSPDFDQTTQSPSNTTTNNTVSNITTTETIKNITNSTITNKSPKTGVIATTGLWFALVGLAGTGLVVNQKKNKKK